MANYNLTSQKIKDTYEQLVQVSGSALVDGTGSAIVVNVDSASFAATASYAENASSDWNDITNKPSGIVSSSAQVDLSQGFGTASQADQSRKSLSVNIPTGISPSDAEYQVPFTYAALSGDDRYLGRDAEITYNPGLDRLSVPNATISNNLIVNGTGSFAYIESVTGSAKIIGDAYIVLNNNTPAQRYAGVVVQDSGSTNNTASFEFDGQTNDWFYEYTDDGGATAEFGVVMFGPGYNTKGSHVYPSNNTILKGTGDHHIEDSNITDDGSKVTVSTPLTASSFNVDSGDISFITQSIAIGNGVNSGDQDVSIGVNVNSNNGYSVAIGSNLTNNGTGGNVLIGRSITTTGDYSIGIGEGAQAQQASGVAIGQNANSAGNSVAIGAGATMGNSYGFAGGYNARANNDASIAIGGDVNVSSNQAIAIGTDTSIDGSSQGAVSFGQNADIATSTHAVVVGRGAGATGANNAIAIGSGSKVTAANEINIGDTFKYDGTSTITLEGDLIKLADSASQTGSLIDNMHPAIASGSSQIKHIVTIDQTAYNTISGSGNVNDDTFYIISDAGDNVYPGNLQVEGQIYSPTFAGTIASSTSSISFDNGNFATLNCASSTFLANPTNLQGGTTYTLIVTNGANISGYGTVWKFAGGTEPTLSANTDVITAVSDGTSLYAAALADFS